MQVGDIEPFEGHANRLGPVREEGISILAGHRVEHVTQRQAHQACVAAAQLAP
jgi:hypothetical protein